MGEQLIKQLTPHLAKMGWPTHKTATAQGRAAYEVGLDKLDSYTGDPKTLAEAIRIFRSGESLPYAYAGVAYALVVGAREADGSYAALGLETAMTWLEKAQELEPDLVDVNVIEALVYVYDGRFADARLVLDYLHAQEPYNFRLHLVEAAYWERQKDWPAAVKAVEEAMKTAVTTPQRLRLRNQLSNFYLESGRLDEALQIYKEQIHLDPQNPLWWYKAALAYWQMDNLVEADRANQQALRLGNLPEAVALADQMKTRRRRETGLLGGLFKS
jgi:tetratricopeptide (TPR) repeat protein